MKIIDFSEKNILPWPLSRKERIPTRSFKKIVIINDPDQFIDFINDDSALALCFDFYAWVYLFHKKKNAIFYEDLIWDDMEHEQVNDIYRCAQSWYLSEDGDISLYKGVSLGSMFNKEAIGLSATSLRFLTCIKKSLNVFSPEKIVLYDNDESGSFFSREFAELLLKDYLSTTQIELVVVPKDKVCKPKLTKYPPLNHRLDSKTFTDKPSLKNRLRALVVKTINQFLPIPFNILRRFDKRPRIWINVMAQFMDPILSEAPKGYAPLVLSRQTPKSPRLILKWLLKGVMWGKLEEKQLSAVDEIELMNCFNRVKDSLNTLPEVTNDDFSYIRRLVFIYVKSRVLSLHNFRVTAEVINSSNNFVKDWNVETLVVQSTVSPEYRTRIEATFRQNKKVIHTFHGWKTYNFPWEDFSAYPKMQHASWGESNTKWLVNHSAPQKSVENVGCPAFEFCLPIKYYDTEKLNQLKNRKILLLGYNTGGPYCPKQSIFQEYEVIYYLNKVLKMMGNNQVRLRLHPHHNYLYHQKISELFGETIDCEGEKGKIAPHLEWCDFAIGSVMTTAYIECFARGKPCFALCIGSGENFDYFEGLDVSRTSSELVNKIIDKKWPNQKINLEKTGMLHTDESVIARLWKFMVKVTDF